MPYTYPPAAPTISGDVVSINRFLNNPTLIARRLRTLLENRYISDAVLTGRFDVEGGAILYETGESIFSGEDPRAIQPGGEYPLVSPPTGPASLAKVTKWGQDAEITDESIKRRKMNPVNRALIKLVNQNVKTVDTTSMSAVASAITQSTAAAAAWTGATAAQMLRDVSLAKANILALNQGYDPDTVVLDDLHYAYALSTFIVAGLLPRESNANNPLVTGDFPVIDGMRWLASPNIPVASVVTVLDSQQLGGMADENLGGPGYARSSETGAGVETKSIRDDENDQYRIRARRVTVPVVLEPASGWKITGA